MTGIYTPTQNALPVEAGDLNPQSSLIEIVAEFSDTVLDETLFIAKIFSQAIIDFFKSANS